MTIQVRSNDPVVPVATAAVAETKTPAPEVNSEQKNDSPESGAEEKEVETNDQDESEDTEEPEGSGESKDIEAKDKPKKKGGFQRRINKLSADKAAAQREADHWKRLALEKEAGEKKPEKVEAKTDTTGKPNPNNFDSHLDYIEALTDWKVDQRDKTSKAETQKAQLMGEQEKLVKAHTERVKSFAEKTADFHDVLEGVDDVPVSATFQELLITSENGPELMYELAKNREEFERIAKLSPLAAAREMGRIESRLSKSSDTEKQSTKTTKAPKPIDPVGGSRGTVQKDPETMTQAEYERWRKNQMKQKSA